MSEPEMTEEDPVQEMPISPPARLSLFQRFIRRWKQFGASSLLLSMTIHGLLLLFAAVAIITTTSTERNIDFLPGGGTAQGAAASEQVAQQVQQKKRKVLMKTPDMQRVVSLSSTAAIQLPDTPPELVNLPDVSSLMGGSMGASGGFGKAGAGGGFGNGIGTGGMSGVAFKPISMFGRQLKARKLGVVMDVSRSMTKHLPRVCHELDIVAKDSPLILYFGCGLMPVTGYKVDDEPHRVGGKDFERYWRVWEGKASLRTPPNEWKTITFDPAAKFPLEDIYKIVNKRRETYYIDFCGITHTWLALMSDRFRFCDAVYWFSDFQDKVDMKQIEKVRKFFKDHRQRLYIHASVRGRSFEIVRDELVIPLGGEVIEDSEPKK